MVNWEKTMTGKAESRTPVPTSNETVLTDSSLTLKMSMINKLKESQKNPAFLDDDDIDNMDFPLPSTSKSASAPSLDELKNLTGSGGGSGGSSSSSRSERVAVAATPQGPKRLDASEYKEYVRFSLFGYLLHIVLIILFSMNNVAGYACIPVTLIQKKPFVKAARSGKTRHTKILQLII